MSTYLQDYFSFYLNKLLATMKVLSDSNELPPPLIILIKISNAIMIIIRRIPHLTLLFGK